MGQRGDADDDDPDYENGVFFSPGRGTVHKRRLLEDDFQKLSLIGKGHFSQVYLVQKNDTGKYYAMKVTQKKTVIESRDVDNVLTERKLLECFSHPFLVHLHYAFQTNTRLFLLMDFVNGGELYYHLTKERRFDERRVRLYCAEIFLALAFLHKNKIIYRDLKLENVLLDREGHCIITDFNFSKLLKRTSDRASTFCGTVDYIAPEVLLSGSTPNRTSKSAGDVMASSEAPSRSGGKHGGYDFAVDWWSLGILTYELLFGLPPFYAQEVNDAYFNILNKPLTFPETVPISSACRDFIRKMLVRDPTKRLAALGIKKHRWFRNMNWRDVYERKIQPSFVPGVSGPDDTNFVDPVFLGSTIESDPIVVEDPKLRSAMQKEFLGFSYSESPPSSPSHHHLSTSPDDSILHSSPLRGYPYDSSPPRDGYRTPPSSPPRGPFRTPPTHSPVGSEPISIPRDRSSRLNGIAVSPIHHSSLSSLDDFVGSPNSRIINVSLSFTDDDDDREEGARMTGLILEDMLDPSPRSTPSRETDSEDLGLFSSSDD